MDAVLEARPLTEAEKRFPPTTVCVTGAAGYCAAHVVVRLLAAGHSVHATYRPGRDDPFTVEWFRGLPGIGARLKWFEADLGQEGSFDAAIAGCKFVIHAAWAMDPDLAMSERVGWAQYVEPAVRGVANVLGAVNRANKAAKRDADKVTRVIFLSTIGACVSWPETTSYSERDFNLTWPTAGVPYLSARTVSEWEAWALAALAGDWELVVIAPSHTWGPSVAPGSLGSPGSHQFVKLLLDGSTSGLYVPMDMNTVDVRDVALAHTLAMVAGPGLGRIVVSESSGQSTEDIVALIRERYPGYAVPSKPLGLWASAAVVWLSRKKISPAFVRLTHRHRSRVSSDKAKAKLGMQFIPLSQTLDDSVAAYVASGQLPPQAKAGAKSSTEPGRWAALRRGSLAIPALALGAAAVAAWWGQREELGAA
eukprot:scaffold26.g3361.t1